jgi:hypothetical protein
MWERGARHNPATFRYRFYLDHRPILPQDPTLSFWRKSYNQYRNIYFGFRTTASKVKYIFSNNIPAQDREDLKTITEYDRIFRKNFKYFSALAALYISGFVFNSVNFKQNYLARIAIVSGAFWVFNKLISKNYLNYFNDITSYYYYKYQHLAVSNINEVKDNRRRFFALDKSAYYRETSKDIRDAGHHPASLEHDHDSSTYYGPYPVNIFLFFMKVFY